MISSNNVLIMFFAIGLFMLLIYSLVVSCDSIDVKEGWVNYQQLPFGNIQTGAGEYKSSKNNTTSNDNNNSNSNSNNGISPLVFYEYPIYRRPYNYPVCHLVNYPIPHCRTDSF
jgi:hypothetical protein